MEAGIPNLVSRLEPMPEVDDVGAYPADEDLSSPDILEVTGGDSEAVTDTIEEALDEDEACLKTASNDYMVYRPLGVIDEHDGSKFDILAYNDTKIEAVLVEPAPHETASVGSVWRFDRDNTDLDITLYDE